MLLTNMQQTANTFSDWLLAELEKREWSQSDLARRAKVSNAAISDVLSGRRNVGRNLAASIAEGLKLPIEDVYREAGILPKAKETAQDQWVRRIEHKLEQITDEDDRRTIEGMIDLLAPDKKTGGRRRAKSET